jgi:hypothetical protein
MNIESELERLAQHVLKEAQKTGTDAPSFEEKTEALKTGTTLFAILTKYRQKSEDSDGSTFGDFARNIEKAEHEDDKPSKVRGRRGAGFQS